MTKRLIFISTLAALLFGAGCATAPATPQPATNPPAAAPAAAPPAVVAPAPDAEPSAQTFKVTRVVDGDTIDVDIAGKIERVRLIGMDSPEVADPRKTVQCFGKEASARATQVLSGQSVRLEADPSQVDRDIYNRLLRYVFLADGTNIDLQMIKEGYAHEYTYKVPYKYQAEFKAAEKEASAAKRGLWADNACPSTTPAAAPTPTPSPTTTPPTPPPATSCVIKGNISSSGEKIYHVPGCASYNATQINESAGERWFCTESEALAAGWRKAKNCP
jgi:micrococcal nuclease